MAKKFKYTIDRRIVDRIYKWLIHRDLAPNNYYLLIARGRRSKMPRSTPIALVEKDGQRWLVAPYGDVNWVLNARTAGEVTLSRGGESETLKLQELSSIEGAPVLKDYITKYAITRPYFDAKPQSPLDEFVKEASLHPVFELTTIGRNL